VIGLETSKYISPDTIKKGAASMKRNKTIFSWLIIATCMAVACCSLSAARAETDEQKKERAQFRDDVDKQLEEMGMPLFTGIAWQKATQAEKVAFVWGICHVITIEKMLAEKLPSLKVQNFSAKAAEGLAGAKINDIVLAVDGFYAAHPAQLDVPVVRVIWDAQIKPKLKTGIAGHPLQ
jgi:hypothetical protein